MEDRIGKGRGRAVQIRQGGMKAITAAKRLRFLDVLAATANVKRAARTAEVDFGAFYRLRRRDASFAQAWQTALEDATVLLDGKMLARALGEADEPEGDAARAGEAGEMGPVLGMHMLKRRDALARGATPNPVTQRRELPIKEVARILLERLDALARHAGRS